MLLRPAGCTYLHSSYWSVSVDNNITAPTKLSSLCPKRLLQRKLFGDFVVLSLSLSVGAFAVLFLPRSIAIWSFGCRDLDPLRSYSALIYWRIWELHQRFFFLVGIGSTAFVIAPLQVCHRPWISTSSSSSSSSGGVSFSSSGFLFWGSIPYFSSLSFLV